ncbi:MAG: tRNA (adenine(22)-N(1))-methyltransferase [Turicibacter sp.]
MSYELSHRLQSCLAFVSPYKTVADIGTDHGYLPCVGILNNLLDYAIAADIGVGPLQAAKQQIARYGLEDKIETRLGGGVSVLQPNEVDAIVIAGMGGKLILSILDDNKSLTSSFKKIILQPNIDGNLLRRWLSAHQFDIINEKIILEDGKFYEIIVSQPNTSCIELNELDIEFGPFLRKEKNEVFRAKWNKEYLKNAEIINQLPVDHPRIVSLEQRQTLLKAVLK